MAHLSHSLPGYRRGGGVIKSLRIAHLSIYKYSLLRRFSSCVVVVGRAMLCGTLVIYAFYSLRPGRCRCPCAPRESVLPILHPHAPEWTSGIEQTLCITPSRHKPPPPQTQPFPSFSSTTLRGKHTLTRIHKHSLCTRLSASACA